MKILEIWSNDKWNYLDYQKRSGPKFQIRTNVADEKEMKRFTNFQSIYNPNPSQKLKIHSLMA